MISAEDLKEVATNTIGILDPSRDGEPAIGTQDLNGCCALVVMDKAVILAHIAPRAPGRIGESQGGLLWFEQMARQVILEVQRRPLLFSVSSASWGVYALDPSIGEVPLDHFKASAEVMFRAANITMRSTYYRVNRAGSSLRRAPTGTLIVVLNDPPRLFLEDKEQISNRSAGVSSTRSTVGNTVQQRPGQNEHAIATLYWKFENNKYYAMQGTIIVREQVNAPINVPIWNSEYWMLADGSKWWRRNTAGEWDEA
ncbi:hypothetical protein LTR35_008337 [Friedmanniomyces endolithicus]|uniref:Uncharacterized protein n=1 Tax=Friedmanniomyces endolithicus TaxID=329885 RepID=A0AAN6FJJ5_9PEZI|nr:hypothetical protein LTR35_008337 [Friedmanniomyces endolithicus]KAK0296354.1 hypothetical protein LTS00_005187 [Friedmanniomyces endolithicus]KAK0319593.1 hypothetical protein LTR82_009298 [Friedmanniomyces endolithicus]KAK1004885.1 hypothetical protein LTR54_007206 [Friedmanniomyces endolithicus]